MHLRPPSGLLWTTKLYIFCKAYGINSRSLCSISGKSSAAPSVAWFR